MYHRRVFAEHRPELLAATMRELAAQARAPIEGRVGVADGPRDAVTVVFHPGAAIEIVVPPDYPSDERRQFFTNRWMGTWALLAHTKLRYPGLVGTTRLWLDDHPGGPGLAYCGNAVSHVLIPDQAFLESGGYAQIRAEIARAWKPWIGRADSLFWRGASTGMRHLLRVNRWQDLPRFKLCLRAQELARPDLLDVGINALVQIWDESERTAIAASGVLRDEAPLLRFLDYRYSVDIDGNTCSWPGLFSKLLMGITTLKVDSEMGFRQWYYDQLVPWRNFVPLSPDMRELIETLEWLRAHSLEAEAIGRAGRQLADQITYEAALETGAATIARFVGR